MARALVLLVLLAGALVPAGAAESPAQRALDYLAATQGEDGAFPIHNAAYYVEAAAALGLDPDAWPSRERSAIDAMRLRSGGDQIAYLHNLRVAHALGVAGYDPRRWHEDDLVALARAGIANGQAGAPGYVNDDAWAIFALRAAGVPAEDRAVQALADAVLAARGADGGWSFSSAAPAGSTDVTGFALAALAAAGRDVAGDERAAVFLQSTRDALRGGHKSLVGEREPNCQATVWALHARRLLGLPRDTESEAFLLRLQRADGGLARSEGETASNPMCTAEAAVFLAGARHPLPGHLPLPEATLHAREPALLPMPPGATHARWVFHGLGAAEGAQPTLEFPAAGAYPYRLDATGPRGLHRGEGTLVVGTARPVVVLPPSLDALRLVPVALDLGVAADPDGEPRAIEVDWGDGSVSPPGPVAERAYRLPGNVTIRVRAQDDAGAWGAWASTTVQVRNRAPTLDDLPARIETDRLTTVTLSPRAADPEGDTVEVTGAEPRRFTTLGEHAWRVEARDPYGGVASATVQVLVRNLPPRLENVAVPVRVAEGEEARFSAGATDPDGNGTTLRWRVGNLTLEGDAVAARLPPGAHEVLVEAEDADGAAVNATRLLLVAPPEAASPRAPWIDRLDLAWTDGALLVEVEASPGAELRLAWSSDAGEGTLALDGSGPHALPVADATRVVVRLTARLDGLEATREVTATRDASPRALPPPTLDAPPARGRVGLPVMLVAVPLVEAVAYAFAFGDGNATGWTTEPAARHTYARSGAFEVVLRARAEDGRESRAAHVLHVDPAPARAIEPAAATPAEALAAASHAPAPPPDGEVLTTEAPRREAPLPWAPLALLLAALAARGRRA